MMRKLQPDIIINNRTGLPGDFDTPEQRIGMYQKRPWESCMTLNGSWAYSPAPVKSMKMILRGLLSAASGNGNTLLSWGAHWNGEFDSTQKNLLLKVGAWLKQYGIAYYATRGGPWMPDNQWGGSVFKENKVFLYVYDWGTAGFSLPVLKGDNVLKAEFLNVGGKLSLSRVGDSLHFAAPITPDSIVTVIELTMSHPVTGVLSPLDGSVFSDPGYGLKIEDHRIATNCWKDNQCTIDLNKISDVTGIGIYQNTGKIRVDISADGKVWKELGMVSSQLRL
jgi:alpha-L-fucosidase